MKPTEHQLQVIAQAAKSLNEGKSCIINGMAGTGKSFITRFIVDLLHNRVCFTATTHEACAQLEAKIEEEVITIHSFLKTKLTRRNGNYILVKNFKAGNPPSGCIVIVDEFSMANKPICKFIKEDMHNNTYLFIGDLAQLPPVNESITEIATWGLPEFTLTEIVRQTSVNDNIPLSRNIEELSKKQNGEFYKWVSEDEIFNIMLNKGATYLSWTNPDVDRINHDYRKNFLGYEEEYHEGESVILQGPYLEGKYSNGERILIKTVTTTKELGYNVFILNKDIKVLAKDSERKYSQDLEALRSKAIINHTWNEFYSLSDRYVKVKHTHAMTIHKSQGGSFKNCIVNISSTYLNSNVEERKKLQYVAITRTTNKNYFL